jgi:hypothetical protein
VLLLPRHPTARQRAAAVVGQAGKTLLQRLKLRTQGGAHENLRLRRGQCFRLFTRCDDLPRLLESGGKRALAP